MTTRCPRCALDLAPTDPVVGEVWIYVEEGVLYRITEAVEAGRIYAIAKRCSAFDARATMAVWPARVRDGSWVRVTTDLDLVPRETKT